MPKITKRCLHFVKVMPRKLWPPFLGHRVECLAMFSLGLMAAASSFGVVKN